MRESTPLPPGLSPLPPSLALSLPPSLPPSPDETVAFDEALTSELGSYSATCIGTFAATPDRFQRWLEVDIQVTNAKFEAIRDAANAWEVCAWHRSSSVLTIPELRPTSFAEGCTNLFYKISDRYKFLSHEMQKQYSEAVQQPLLSYLIEWLEREARACAVQEAVGKHGGVVNRASW